MVGASREQRQAHAADVTRRAVALHRDAACGTSRRERSVHTVETMSECKPVQLPVRSPVLRLWSAIAVGGLLLVAGCRSDDIGSPEMPADRDAIVIQFSTRGGGLPDPSLPGKILAAVPEITAYGDGRVVLVTGKDGQLPALSQASVTRSDLADLLTDAQAAGLLTAEEPDTGEDVVAQQLFDFPSTEVILAEATSTHEFSIYALSAEGEVRGLSDEQRKARAAAADIESRLHAMVEKNAGEYAPYELAAYVSPRAQSGPSDPAEDPTLWPLGSLARGGEPVGEGWRCFHIAGFHPVVDTVAAARRAPSSTWLSADQEWTVFIRPLLPHEHGCT